MWTKNIWERKTREIDNKEKKKANINDQRGVFFCAVRIHAFSESLLTPLLRVCSICVAYVARLGCVYFRGMRYELHAANMAENDVLTSCCEGGRLLDVCIFHRRQNYRKAPG